MGGPARSWVSVICETVRFHYLFSGGGGGGNAEALHRLFQRSDIHRLGQMLVHAGLLALFHILKEGVCGQRLRPVRTGSCVDSPIKVVTLYSSIMLKPFQAYFEFLAIICIKNREEI